MRDHVLSDELRYYVEPARTQFLLDGILVALEALHAEGRVHPDLQPDNVAISAWDEISLTGIDGPVQRVSPFVAPETRADGTLTTSSNMFSFGVMMQRFLPKEGRTKPQRLAAIFAAECIYPPDSRSTPQVARERVRSLGWLTGQQPPWTPHFTPIDETERGLVAALRANSGDVATRQVYADWLEEHGHGERAQFIRSELDADLKTLRGLAEPADLKWRAAVSRAPIFGCKQADGCPGSWGAMTGDDNETRTCGKCNASVRYCWTTPELEERARNREAIAIDAALHTDESVRRYRELSLVPPPGLRAPIGNPPPPRIDAPPRPAIPHAPPTPPAIDPPTPNVNPPAPRTAERTLDIDLSDAPGEKTGVLARFFGWFKRK